MHLDRSETAWNLIKCEGFEHQTPVLEAWQLGYAPHVYNTVYVLVYRSAAAVTAEGSTITRGAKRIIIPDPECFERVHSSSAAD
jgi:hypothetical protein